MYRLLALLLVLAVLPRPLFADDDLPGKKKPPAMVAGKTIHQWIKDLRHVDPSVRRDAVQAIPLFGEYSAEAAPEVTRMLGYDPDVTLRINAAVTLMRSEVRDKDVPKAVQMLVEQMKSTQVTLRYHSIVTIARFEELGVEAIPALAFASADKYSWEIRQAACNALFNTGAKNRDVRAIRPLVTATGDYASKVRLEAVMSLACMGKIQDPTLRNDMVKALHARSRDSQRAVVVWSYYGLMVNDRIDDVYLNAIVNLLRTGDVQTKIHALRALAMLKREARPKLNDMAEAILDQDPFVQMTACNVLAELSKDVFPGDRTVANLEKLSKDEKADPPVKYLATQALAHITKTTARKDDNKAERKDDNKAERKDDKRRSARRDSSS